MEKDKYDFILELIENKKLYPSQKERILRLSVLEVKKEGNKKDTELLKRIKEIEDKLSIFKGVEKTPQKTIEEKKNLPEPNPKHVADFMALFNQRDGLKYLTHDFDEDGNFAVDNFLISANKVFEQATKKLNIPKSLWAIVKQFAFDSKQTEWTSISEDYKKFILIKIGWATKELRDWSKQNHLHPIRNEEYRKMIADFKRITRIEKSNLNKLVFTTLNDIFKSELNSFVIEMKDLEKADFYSHVGNLKIALEAVFEEVKRHSNTSEKKKISIKYLRTLSDEGYYLRQVVITHHNSFPPKELRLLLKEWQEKGNMGKIREKLRGYCYWSVETLIEETPIRVNILKDKDSPEYEIFEPFPEGFTHLLTFYYK